MVTSTALTTEPHPLMRPASAEDRPELERIREAAFAPVFASFRAILGEEI